MCRNISAWLEPNSPPCISLINKLVFKLQDRSYQHIWLPRCNDMQQWELSIGLTRKLNFHHVQITFLLLPTLVYVLSHGRGIHVHMIVRIDGFRLRIEMV